MKKNLVYKLFFTCLALLAIYFVYFSPIQLGGDIVEYHGMTDSLIKDRTIRLTDTTAYNISTYLSPEYLKDPGYYIKGIDGDRYPVHFFFYSLLAVPVRLVLHFLHLNELLTLRMTNLVLFGAGIYFIMKRFLKSEKERLILLGLVLASPVISFLIWPGPDLYFMLLLLVGLFYFFEGSILKSLTAVALASWHSQPLILIDFALAGYYLYKQIRLQKTDGGRILSVSLRPFALVAGVIGLAAIPYLYNIYIFNTLSPWTILQDGWTVLNGFGLQNISLQKFLETFFDLDIGLLWYAPFSIILGGIIIASRIRMDRKVQLITIAYLITSFFYETNPAWNYGTAGFGPSKHAIFLLPLFIYFATKIKRKNIATTAGVILLSIWQIAILSVNGLFAPQLPFALYHSPYATFALSNFPTLYNPTPEIFVDRTNHTDIQHPTSAVYKVDGECKKVYALKTDKALIEKQCGAIPPQYQPFFDDPLRRKSNIDRTVKTNQATFWPDPAACGKEYVTSETAPFVCMRTLDEVMKATGIFESTRFTKVPGFNFPGVWRLTDGPIVSLTVPPGYIIDYSSFEGTYISY